MSEIDRRSWGSWELRAEPESLAIEGYATVWDAEYLVAGGPDDGGWVEVVRRGAADRALAERQDVRLLVNHDGVPLARTRSGTLQLAADDLGLRVTAELDPTNPTVQELRSALTRRDLDEMSFAFRVRDQRWSKDYSTREILDVDLYDVAVVTYPANPATHVQPQRDVGRPNLPIRLARMRMRLRAMI